MNTIHISKPSLTNAEKQAVMDVLDSGFLAQGARTASFEKEFAEMLGVKHAIAVSNGTCALQIALLAEGIGPGDEVITSPFTFIATANAIVFTGAKPVFVDIDIDSFNISPEQIEDAITPRTKAIIPVHLYGQMCDMDEIQTIADKHGLKIIEDACQSVLATYKGRSAGSIGTGTFSFYATKNLTTGEGGMITTNNDEVADASRLIRNHGMRQRYVHEIIGYNFRMTDIQAAIGLVQLERLPELTKKRRENATYYHENIKSVVRPKVLANRTHVWHQYTIRIEDGERDSALKKLSQAGIGYGIYYPIPLHKQNSMKKYVDEVELPITDQASKQVISIPIHPGLSQEELDRVVTEVNKL
jgi:dTDP-4-amino-4,6-dideoxygalactose transaminase